MRSTVHRLLLLLVVIATGTRLVQVPETWADEPPAPVASEPNTALPRVIRTAEQAEATEDPRALWESGHTLLDEGDAETARMLFETALDREEIHRYMNPRTEVREALILEALGEHDSAAENYRKGFETDLQTTLLVLRILSSHPERNALVEEGLADLNERVERAKAGEEVVIYTTSKGAPRYLQAMTSKEAVAELQRSGTLRYCYIDHLDLSAAAVPELPKSIQLNRCVVGSITIPDREVESLGLRIIALGDVNIGKTWEGETNRSRTIPGSRVHDVIIRESMFLGHVNLQDVTIDGRNALFALTVFEGPADFRDALFHGVADFRFSVFGEGANYKGMTLTNSAYFGHTRYIEDVNFRGMRSREDLFFNSAHFEKAAAFDKCEWDRGATFENSLFEGPISFHASRMGGRLNMSRTRVVDTLTAKEMQMGGMDFIGASLEGDASFIDVHFGGKVRFSLDDVTRAEYRSDPTPLLSLYRYYQGDEDAEEPLTTQSSYGVRDVDDLIAHVEGNITFLNSVFGGFCIFERVTFGQPGIPSMAQFYNTQFLGETHFERTEWHSTADFTTIFADELSLNEATFHDQIILDDANVRGRITLTDASLDDGSLLSFYGAEIRHFEIEQRQLLDSEGDHLMFYERCAYGDIDETDPRIVRMMRGADPGDDPIRSQCYDRVIDEYIDLKDSFGDRAMIDAEDWAYWWMRHHEMRSESIFGGFKGKLWAGLVAWPIFELAFGWGVKLGNLALTSLFVCLVFAVIYRVYCPDTICTYAGRDVPIRDIPWHGLFYISLQSFGAFNTGWDFGEDDTRFQYLNTLQTFVGIIVLTFFVGAYTRMILA